MRRWVMDRLRAVAHLTIRPAIELASKRSYATEILGAVLFVVCIIALVVGVFCL